MKFSQKEKEKLQAKIIERVVELKCPMCKGDNFIMAAGYFNNTLQSNLHITSLGGSSIPTIPIICENCGFTSQHALGILDNLNDLEDEKH
jgi:predicted RNA-binding Zn-ribbon protein involved in translation (DUF1610 family)